MATGPQLVHKQFNSPMGLYSQQNIQETLNKHIHNLDNGATGIDFNDPATGKPANLANSAVLRMLEEEERQRRGYPNQKKVVWPPVPETNGYHQSPPQQQQQHQAPAYYNSTQPSAPQNQYRQSPQNQPQAHQHQSQVPQHRSQVPQQQYQPQQQQYQQSQQGPCEGRRQEQAAINRLIPVGPGASPVYRPGPASPQAPKSRWTPGQSPAPQANYQQPSYAPQQQFSPQPPQYSPQQQQFSPQQQQFSPQQQQFSPQQQQFSPQPQYSPQPPQYSPQPQQYQQQQYKPQFEPPPTTVTLRQQPPVHQRPPPVFPSQPATASFQGGVNMRGDQKWPPQSVKEAVEAENEARRQLAKGPACRPRKVKKDYSAFFAQNALNSTYPGYRVPPGTQHIVDQSGQTSF